MLQFKCDFPHLPSPATRSKPLHSPLKCVGHKSVHKSVCKPVCRFFKSFAQAYEPFRSTVFPTCSVAVSMSHSSLHQPFATSAPCVSPVRITTATLTRTTTATATRTTSAPTSATRSPYSPYPACVSSPLLQHFLFHHRRTVAELLQFLLPFYLPELWLVLLTL